MLLQGSASFCWTSPYFVCRYIWCELTGLSLVSVNNKSFITLLLIPFRSGRNGRNFSYRYANRYRNTPRSTSGQISGRFGPFWSFRPIPAKMQISAGTGFGLLLTFFFFNFIWEFFWWWIWSFSHGWWWGGGVNFVLFDI